MAIPCCPFVLVTFLNQIKVPKVGDLHPWGEGGELQLEKTWTPRTSWGVARKGPGDVPRDAAAG